MNSSTNLATSLTDGAEPAELSDGELLIATRRLVGRSNQLLAALIAHLGELEARGIHRTRACASLYTYCIYELRFSEDEAYRRVAAARLVRRFPTLLPAIAAGELHLTGLLMLGPHLTDSNLIEVLARAKHRTKKEIARLVRVLDPLPDVPSRIEPLGPAPARLVPDAPTWNQFVQSTCTVRELTPGERPRDWAENSAEGAESQAGDERTDVEDKVSCEAPEPSTLERPGSAPKPFTPERYSVQFTASDEYVELVNRARALLSHSAPRLTLDELHVRALRSLVTELEHQRYGTTTRPRKRSLGTSVATTSSTSRADSSESPPAPPCELRAPREIGDGQDGEDELAGSKPPRWRGRYVPAPVRRIVFERDQGRCTYTDASGRRCAETHQIELHHLIAFARGGEPTEQNLTLRCRAHNTLAAEEDFGREFVVAVRGSSDHDPWPR